MTVGERVDLLVNSTDDYVEHRINTSDEFMEMMKFMFSEKYKLLEKKEKQSGWYYFKNEEQLKE